MASFYKYNRIDLATDAIRLVKLLKGDKSQSIQCEIFETYLHQIKGVPYEALSYVWGTTPSSHQIWLESCNFSVKENLYEALVHLRLPDEDRVLWVDAICIDQSNPAERGHQVGQMRLVYQNAQRVIIWLGASDNDIDCLYDWMTALDKQMLTIAQPHTMDVWENQWLFVAWQLYERSPPSGIREALAGLFRRDWFSRIWVLQEVAFAKSAMITCGRREINSRVFVIMPSLLNVNCEEGKQARLDIMPGIMRVESWWAGGKDLLTLLRKFGRSKATDERDIIYALLVVSADAHSSEFLRPDYEIETPQAIQQSIAFFLLQQRILSKETLTQSLPEWSMCEFLDALNDLDLAVFKWATDKAQDALLYDMIICQRTKRNSERLKQYMRCKSHHGPCITIAIKKNNPDLMDLLLQDPGANVQTRDSDGKTPVVVAVEHGNMVAAHLITQHRQFVISRRNSSRGFNKAILASAKLGAADLRQLLLHNPEFINFARHFRGRKLILTAAKHGDLATVEWILNQSENSLRTAAGADWKDYNDWLVQVCSQGRAAGLSPLELQLIAGFSVIISQHQCRRCTENKVQNATDAGEFRSLRRNVYVEARLKEGGWFGFQTPLGYAAQGGNTRAVSFLLDKGADINSRDCDERANTPLCNAAWHGHLDTVKLLVEKGADIELMTETADKSTALWCAASKGRTDIVRCLLKAGANVRIGRDVPHKYVHKILRPRQMILFTKLREKGMSIKIAIRLAVRAVY